MTTYATAASVKKLAARVTDLEARVTELETPATPPPTPPPTGTPAFLTGLSKQFSDDCSVPDPVASIKWCLYSAQRKDGVESSTQYPHNATELAPGRFQQLMSGGPNNKPYYRFYAPQGDNMWTPGTSGRSELGYPKGSPGNEPSHPGPPGAFFFYEGRHHVIMFSTRLPSPWDVNAGSWRVLHQWKQNEWVDTGGVSPCLALEQRAGNYILTNFGGPIIWSMPATAGVWVNWAFDITFSSDPAKGKVKVYADTNLDGTYDYASSGWTGKTLFPRPGGGTGVEAMWSNGCYEGVGGDTCDHSNYSIWG